MAGDLILVPLNILSKPHICNRGTSGLTSNIAGTGSINLGAHNTAAGRQETRRLTALRDEILEVDRRAARVASATRAAIAAGISLEAFPALKPDAAHYESQPWPPPQTIDDIIQLGLARYNSNQQNGITEPPHPTYSHPDRTTPDQELAAHRVWIVELLGSDHPFSWEESQDVPLEQPSNDFRQEFEMIMRSRETRRRR